MGTDCKDENCEICGGKMCLKKEDEREVVNELVNAEKDYYTLGEVIEMDLVIQMGNAIKSMGHKRTWETIEHIRNAKQRVVFRQGFFKAGGKIC